MRYNYTVLNNYVTNITNKVNILSKYKQSAFIKCSKENIYSLDNILKSQVKFAGQNIFIEFHGNLTNSKVEIAAQLDKLLKTKTTNIIVQDKNGFVLIKGNGISQYKGSFQFEINKNTNNLDIKVGIHSGSIIPPKLVLDSFLLSDTKINVKNVTKSLNNSFSIIDQEDLTDHLDIKSNNTLLSNKSIEYKLDKDIIINIQDNTSGNDVASTKSIEVKLGASEVSNPFDDMKMDSIIGLGSENFIEDNVEYIESYREMETSGVYNDLFI